MVTKQAFWVRSGDKKLSLSKSFQGIAIGCARIDFHLCSVGYFRSSKMCIFEGEGSVCVYMYIVEINLCDFCEQPTKINLSFCHYYSHLYIPN